MSIASKPGTYNNFIGKIKYGKTDCDINGATFEILEKTKSFKGQKDIDIDFYKGTIVSGSLYHTDIRHCKFKGGELSFSVWRDGIFDGGSINFTTWLDGEWVSGDWDICNYDKFGRHRLMPPPFDIFDEAKDVITKQGRYRNFTGRVRYGRSDFTIKNGDVEIFNNGIYPIAIDDGVIKGGFLSKTIVTYAVLNGGQFFDGSWRNGIFNGGVFSGEYWFDGIFKNGTWENGIWGGGDWYGGYDRKGNYHKKGDNPNKWPIE